MLKRTSDPPVCPESRDLLCLSIKGAPGIFFQIRLASGVLKKDLKSAIWLKYQTTQYPLHSLAS